MKECKHNFYYYPSTNEEGWKCVECDHKPGEPEGFSPQPDRDEIYITVGGLLNDFANSELIYVSNGSEGDYLTAMAADRCKAEGVYDQYSILRFLIELMQPSHAEYWKKVSDGIIAGNDPRDRCHCGKLANMFSGGQKFCSFECQKQTGFVFA